MEGEGSPVGVKDAADDADATDEGGGPPGVVEGCSVPRPKAVLLALRSGVAGEEPNSDQLKDMVGGGGSGAPRNRELIARPRRALFQR